MLTSVVALLAGLALLVYGGERTVAGASALAREVGVSVFFVGATLVATGSSLPEVATAIYAAVYGAGDFAVGHIIGSVTSQITLGIGLVALLAPLATGREKVRTYGGGMLLAMGAMLVALWSGRITHLEGAVMAALYVAFLLFRYEHEDYEPALARRISSIDSRRRAVAWVVVGLMGVIVGGHLLVTGGMALARHLGVPPDVIGVLTGLGTTLPEIVIAVLAVRREQSGIAIGTLLGSNITDPLFSLGIGAAVGGIELTHRASAVRSGTYMLFTATLVVGVFYWRERLTRRAGAGCVVLYLLSFTVL